MDAKSLIFAIQGDSHINQRGSAIDCQLVYSRQFGFIFTMARDGRGRWLPFRFVARRKAVSGAKCAPVTADPVEGAPDQGAEIEMPATVSRSAGVNPEAP